MAKTLSANVTNGIAASQNQPVYLIRIIPVSGDNLYFSSPTDFTDGGDSYDGSIIQRGGIGSVTHSIRLERGGNTGTISGFKIQLENAGLYSDTLAGTQYEMATVEIRLIFNDQASATWANACPIFLGYIENISWNFDEVMLDCKSGWYKKHTELLTNDVLTVDEYSNIPDGNIGKPVPVIYGDFYNGDVHKNAIPAGRYAGTDRRDYHDNTIAYRVDHVPTSTNTLASLVIARHDLHADPDNTNNFLRTYVEGMWFGVGDYGTPSYASSRFILTGAQRGGLLLRLISTRFVGSSGTNNPTNAVNENPDDYATILSGGSYYTEYGFTIPEFSPLSESYNVTVYAQDARASGGTVQVTITIYDQDGNQLDTALHTTNNVFPTFGNTVAITPVLTVGAEILKSGITIKIKNDAIDQSYYLKNLFLDFAPTMIIDEEDQYFVECRGREYTSWITGRTHSSGDLIENPSGLMESILRDELGFADADVDEDAFDSVDAGRSGWSFAANMLDPIQSLDALSQIALESMIGHIEDWASEETVFLLTPTGSPAAIDNTLIIYDGNRPKIIVGKTRVNDLFNDFILKYKRNYASGEYEKILFCNKDDSNLAAAGATYEGYCNDLFADYGIQRTWDYDADWIRKAATAELFLKNLIEWITFDGAGLRHIVKMETHLGAIDLEIGDQRLIDHSILPAAINNSAHFLLIGQKVMPEKNRIELTWLEIGT